MGVRGSAPAIPSVTIDPGRNGGRIAEVSVKAISGGRKMGTGPGAGPGPQDIYESARERAEVEAARWPYDWVEGVDYPKKEDRSAVSGRLVLDDPGAAQEFTNLNVGLTAPAYISPRPAGSPQAVTDWQRDAKFYQFWTVGDSDGSFRIEKVRPGKYCLHAFTDGVLGEYVTEVSVGKGEKLDLGTLD